MSKGLMIETTPSLISVLVWGINLDVRRIRHLFDTNHDMHKASLFEIRL